MKILVILLKRIGDALIALPVCGSLRKTYPEARIDYMLYDDIAPLFRDHPVIDNVITLSAEERSRPLKYMRKILSIRRTGYDVVLDLKSLPSGTFATFLSGARQTVGFDRPRSRGWVYKTRVPRRVPGTNAVDKRLRVLEGLGWSIQRDTRISVRLPEPEVQRMHSRMTAAGVDMDRVVLLFHITASRARKTWPMDCFVAVMEHCQRRYAAQMVMSWGPGEHGYVQEAASRLRHASDAYTSVATTDIRELAALAANCDMFVGNDSGPRHIAEAVGTPTLAVFAPLEKKTNWMPTLNERNQGVDLSDVMELSAEQDRDSLPGIKENPERYYRMITPAIVIERLDRMLAPLLAAKAQH